MRRFRPLAFLLLAATLWPGTAAAQDAAPIEPDAQVVLAGSVDVPRGDAVGEVVVFSGGVTVHGVVEGDVVVFDGPVLVTGQVDGSVIVAKGPVELQGSARVGGDVLTSRPATIERGAKVGGDVRQDVRFSLQAPLAVLGELLGPVAVALSVLLTGLALLFLAPRGADAVAETLADAPLTSLGWGILVGASAPVTGVALCVLVLGLPLGLALLLSLGLWWLVGLTWAAWCAGRSLVGPPRSRVVAFLAGWAIVAAIGLVPALNVAAWILAPTLGLGAMIVAMWRARHHGHHRGRHRRRTPSQDDLVEAGIA